MPDMSVESLKSRLARAEPVGATKGPDAPPDDPETLTLADMNKGHALRPANKNLTRIHIIKKDGKVVSFQNHFLDAKSTFEGSKFTLLFAGAKHWEVTVTGHGAKFWAVYDYCTLHRWPYLKEATGSMAGMADNADAVFVSIDIKDATPGPEQ